MQLFDVVLYFSIGFNTLIVGRLTLATVAGFWFQFLAGAAVSGWSVVLLFPLPLYI